MAYTPEQIKQVCALGYEIMKEFTNVQNCTFPAAAVTSAMVANKTAEEVGRAAYDSIIKLPIRQGAYSLVGMGDSMHNIASYLEKEIVKTILSFTPVEDEDNEETT